MESAIELFPYGELEGVPVLAIRATAGTDKDQLITEALRKQRPGIRALWVKSAEWGGVEWDTALLYFLADERLRSPVVVVRDLEATGWSSIALYWIGDCTTFLAEPTTIKQLSEKLVALDFIPHLSELILRRPPVGNLKPVLLDEIHSSLSVEGVGTIYCPPGDRSYQEAAAMQVSRCATPWMVRFDHLTPNERANAYPVEQPSGTEEPTDGV